MSRVSVDGFDRVDKQRKRAPGKLAAAASRVLPSVDLAEVWHPYDKQARFIGSAKFFNLFLGGLGSGKTHALAAWAVARALANPNPDGRPRVGVGAVFGRTSIDLNTVILPEIFEHLQKLEDATGFCWISDHDRGNAKLTLVNGATIYYRPYNRIGKVRGLTLTWAALDEVEYSEAEPEEIWTVITTRLRGQGPLPGVAFATSPNGYRGITKRFVDAQLHYADAVARGDVVAARRWSQYYTVTATSYDNPYNPEHFSEALESLKMSKRRYAQEVLGKVLKPLNAVFDLDGRHVVDWNWREHLHLPQVFGVDWGSGKHNIALHFQVLPAGRWVCCRELIDDVSPRGKFLDRVVTFIADTGKDPALIGADRACPVENGALARRFPRTPVMGMKSREEQSVVAGIEVVRDLLDPVRGDPELVYARSLSHVVVGETAGILPAMRGGYRYRVDAMGLATSHPNKDNINDHAADCQRYPIVASAAMTELHGGRTLTLPIVQGESAAGNSSRQTRL